MPHCSELHNSDMRLDEHAGGCHGQHPAGMIEWTKLVIVTIWAIRILKLVPIGAIRIPKSLKNRKRGRRRRVRQQRHGKCVSTARYKRQISTSIKYILRQVVLNNHE